MRSDGACMKVHISANTGGDVRGQIADLHMSKAPVLHY